VRDFTIGIAERVHIDERRAMLADIFPADVVEVNAVNINPKASAGDWHRHERQTDFWVVVAGTLWVGLKNDDTHVTLQMDIGSHAGDVVQIPPGWWHTYKAGPEGAVLVYGMTNKWDGTDEDRLPFTVGEMVLYG